MVDLLRTPYLLFSFNQVIFLLVVPAMFDVVGSAFANFGLLYTSSSIFQVMKCFVIVFTAILKVTILKHKLTHYMWWGVIINMAAMVIVGYSAKGQEEEGGEYP